MSSLHFQKETRTLLVDDEDIAIHRLKKALSAYSHIKIIGEIKDGKSAIEFINHQKPDLVFLDIQMPEFNGFEVLSHLEHTSLIVFVTAYEEYAIKAFEKNLLDYLLKPVEDERLALTIQRVTTQKNEEVNILTKIKNMIGESRTAETISTIPVKIGNKINLIPIDDICFFEAKDKYVYIHSQAEEKLIEYSLTYLQDRLPAQFIKVHRGFIINKLKIKEIQKYFKGTYILYMNDIKNSKIKSAYSYAETIRAKLLLP
ncbi:LytTR family transcriptional regulator DNA-binding domain-containing protein [Pedobacter sp. PAMC26386]|nr:LytTR family transcriptional regulator DNA-binding domain-containing protein [Pedobacter sp. PAMC26386]